MRNNPENPAGRQVVAVVKGTEDGLIFEGYGTKETMK